MSVALGGSISEEDLLEKVTGEERLLSNLGERIRDVRQGPDGYLYLLSDDSNGKVLRVRPAR